MNLSSLLLGARFPTLTSYFSPIYLAAFLPICLVLYILSPQRVRRYVLLGSGVVFFWLISGKLVAYLALSVLSMHYFGLWLDRIHHQRQEALQQVERPQRKAIRQQYLRRSRGVLAFAATLHIGGLLLLKYTPFFSTNLNTLLKWLNLPIRLAVPSFLLPIGISFFTLQAVSYLVDVYRETIPADDNVLRLGLFLSFFPQIVEGPICRYGQTAHQLWKVEAIRYDNLVLGSQRILFGMMKKVVIADRLNPLILQIFNGYPQYQGGILFLGAVCYTIQLYMDFSGTMDAVLGTAQIFGVTLPENFRRPFFSRSISEFWQRWHITLGTWFKDYIFYPVTMSKPMKSLTAKARKPLGNHFGPLVAGGIALLCVWVCNGLWHGSAWSYLFFGMYHFALILSGNIITPGAKRVQQWLHINPDSFGYHLFQMVRTGLLVVIGELFFRANGLRAGLAMFGRIITDFRFDSFNDQLLLQLGVDRFDLFIVGVALIIVWVVSLLQERGMSVRATLRTKPMAVRWAVLYSLLLFIVIFGAYGLGYVPVDPIYANF